MSEDQAMRIGSLIRDMADDARIRERRGEPREAAEFLANAAALRALLDERERLKGALEAIRALPGWRWDEMPGIAAAALDPAPGRGGV